MKMMTGTTGSMRGATKVGLAALLVLALLSTVLGSASAQQGTDPNTDAIGVDYSDVAPLPGDADAPGGEVASFDLAAVPDDLSPRIIGGQPASIGNFPHMVQLHYRPQGGPAQFCGGSIIRASWILTAAHCVQDLSPSQITVTAGSTFETVNSGQQRRVTSIKIHNRWNGNGRGGVGNGYDIALLKLSSPLRFNANVQAIPVASRSDLTNATGGWLAGWGSIDTDLPGDQSDRLRAVYVAIQSDSQCRNVLGSTFKASREVCMGDPGQGACVGDSGGPLGVLVDGVWMVAGVSSFVVGQNLGNGAFRCTGGVHRTIYGEAPAFQDWLFDNLPRRTCEGRTATVDLALSMSATGGRDVIVGTAGPDLIRARGGNDVICAMGGADEVVAGPGDDRVYAGSGGDLLKGNGGEDIMYGEDGRDDLRGGGSDDRLFGGPDDDELNGGSGNNDKCTGGSGSDTHAASCETTSS